MSGTRSTGNEQYSSPASYIVLYNFPTKTRVPVDPSDTTWIIVATGLVMMMTPSLGFFEAGGFKPTPIRTLERKA